ncbi:MAG: hypothetical protein ACK55I_37765, partial [bacterium]
MEHNLGGGQRSVPHGIRRGDEELLRAQPRLVERRDALLPDHLQRQPQDRSGERDVARSERVGDTANHLADPVTQLRELHREPRQRLAA